MISFFFVMPMRRNNIKCQYMFWLPLKNLIGKWLIETCVSYNPSKSLCRYKMKNNNMCNWNIVQSVWIIYKIFDIKFPVFSFLVTMYCRIDDGDSIVCICGMNCLQQCQLALYVHINDLRFNMISTNGGDNKCRYMIHLPIKILWWSLIFH